MRISNENVELNYQNVKKFFDNRASKFNEEQPYTVTMYQDKNPEIAIKRDRHEKNKILKYLKLNTTTRVLDVGCGIGRWADELDGKIASYLGIDLSEELIKICEQKNQNRHFHYLVQSVTAPDFVSQISKYGPFDLVIISGVLLYLNDPEMMNCLNGITSVTAPHAQLYIREPIGLECRMTLKDFYSDELEDHYSAVYRTRDEFDQIFSSTLTLNGFQLNANEFLYDESLNNRRETAQYYYIFEKISLRKVFVFDLDGTITKQEILPLIAKNLNLFDEITKLTQKTLSGEIGFEESFRLRFEILKKVPISEVRQIVEKVEIHKELEEFIQKHSSNCIVVTGNLDEWIEPLIRRLGCKFYTSKATRDGDYLTCLNYIMEKGQAVQEIRNEFDHIIAIGESNNDIPMFKEANISIAFGGTHDPISKLLPFSNFVINRGDVLCNLLKTL